MTEQEFGSAAKVRIVLAEPDQPQLLDVALHLMAIRDLYDLAAIYGTESSNLEEQWPFNPFNPDSGRSQGWPEPQLARLATGNSLLAVIGGLATAAITPFTKLLVTVRDWKSEKEITKLEVELKRLEIEGKRLDLKGRNLEIDREAMVNEVFRAYLAEHGFGGLLPHVAERVRQVAQSLPAITEIDVVDGNA